MTGYMMFGKGVFPRGPWGIADFVFGELRLTTNGIANVRDTISGVKKYRNSKTDLERKQAMEQTSVNFFYSIANLLGWTFCIAAAVVPKPGYDPNEITDNKGWHMMRDPLLYDTLGNALGLLAVGGGLYYYHYKAKQIIDRLNRERTQVEKNSGLTKKDVEEIIIKELEKDAGNGNNPNININIKEKAKEMATEVYDLYIQLELSGKNLRTEKSKDGTHHQVDVSTTANRTELFNVLHACSEKSFEKTYSSGAGVVDVEKALTKPNPAAKKCIYSVPCGKW